jgi:hypothetical protein
MATIGDLVNDAELLLEYSITNKTLLPAGCAKALKDARGQIAALEAPGKPRDDFFQALSDAVGAVPLSAAEIRVAAKRLERIRPLVSDAHQLLAYAAASAKKVDDDVRKSLLNVADSVERGTPTVADEQTLFKAYEALTTSTAPVTAETLEASKTKLPTLGQIFSKDGFVGAMKGLTLGRFFNAILFIVVLLVTCAALGYYSVGSTGLARYRELHATLSRLESELPLKQELAALRVAEEAKQASDADASAESRETARKNRMEAERLAKIDEDTIAQIRTEHSAIPLHLWKWSQQQCEESASFLFRWTLCSEIDKVAPGAAAPSETAMLEAARTVAARLSEIYLPLLLGWLGAYAFILRNMTKEIGEKSFAKSSALRHIVRLGL